MRRHLATTLAAACLAALFVAPEAASAAVPAGPAQVWAAQEAMNLAVTWAPPLDRTGVTGYRVTTSPATTTVDVPVGTEHAVVPNAPLGTEFTVHVASLAGAETSAATDALSPVTIKPLGGSLHAIPPVRIADTRTGVPSGGPTNSIVVPIKGTAAFPGSDIGSVVLNVTVTAPAAAGFLTAYPSGNSRPDASNLNYVKGQTVSGLVVVPVGQDGTITLYSLAPAQIVVDANGWFSTAATASPAELFHALTPARLMDTRTKLGASTPGPRTTVNLKVTGAGGVPAQHVGAVVLNLTSAGSTAAGYVTAFPKDSARPLASSLNFAAGQVVANRVIVPVSATGYVSLYNFAGSTPLVADVTGWFGDGSDANAGGAYYVGVNPTRVADTRWGTNNTNTVLVPGESRVMGVAGHDQIPSAVSSTPATGYIATLTAVPYGSGYLTAYPSDKARPTASDLNFTGDRNVANLVVGRLGGDGSVKVYNNTGYTAVILDVFGYFVGDGTITPAHLQQSATYGGASGVAVDTTGHAWVGGSTTFGYPRAWATVHAWSGTAWSTTLLPEPAGSKGSEITSVAAISATDVWAAGTYRTSDYYGESHLLIEHYDGTAWHLSASPVGGAGDQTMIRGIVALATDDVWAVGAEYTDQVLGGVALHWDGSTWTRVPAPDTRYLFAVADDHQGGAVAVGETSGGSYTVRVLGRDAQMPAPAYAPGGPDWLFGVGMTGANDGWAVGDLGTVGYHWTNGAWQPVNLGAAGIDMRFHGVASTSASDVWLAGMGAPADGKPYKGVIEHWNGTAWSVVAAPQPGDTSYLYAVAARTPSDVWTVGGTTAGYTTKGYAQHWNGTSWTTTLLPYATYSR